MKTRIYTIDEKNIDLEIMKEAGAVIAAGGLVGFPTETVYGLGADAMDASASEKIYAAKGRPSDNPLIVHIADLDALKDIALEVPDAVYILAEKYWPGPLTMIMKKGPKVPYKTTGGLDTVAVRMPSNAIALALIKASGTYIAAPSGNLSGRPSPTLASHMIEDMSGRIDMIIDGGKVGIGLESTIVDLTGDVPMILRPGYITKEMLERDLGCVEVDPAIVAGNEDKNFRPKAPGMKYRHYAPKGDLTIVEGQSDDVILCINRLALEQKHAGKKVAIIATDETRHLYDSDFIFSIGSREHEETIAANLFEILRDMDGLSMDVIYSESFAEGHLGQAIMNRLLKAAGHQVIEA